MLKICTRTVPTPALAAAAPDATRSRRRGRIRVSREGDSNLYYLSKVLYGKKPQEGRVMVTTAIVDALEVECETLHDRNSPQILSIPDVRVISTYPLATSHYQSFRTRLKVVMLSGCSGLTQIPWRQSEFFQAHKIYEPYELIPYLAC